MSENFSLSQTLGGLRIANPDDDNNSSPSSPPLGERSQGHQQPSSRSPLGEVTLSSDQEQKPDQTLPPLSAGQSLGFDPQTFAATSPKPFAGTSPPAPPRHSSLPPAEQTSQSSPHSPTSAILQGQLSPRQSSKSAKTSDGLSRDYTPSSSAPRPASQLYQLTDAATNSGTSLQGPYRYRDDTTVPGMAGGVRRSSSRSAALAMQAGVPTMEDSAGDRPSKYAQQALGGNGPAPPRRSSQRVLLGTNPGATGAMGGPASAIDGAPTPSSEAWKEKGATVISKQDVDANGKVITRVMKKGVKDFNFGRTLGEGSYSTVLAATDRQTLREYAIKVLDKRHIIKEKKVKYVNIEKDALNRLTEHPGIVRLYYTFQDEYSLYFVLDLAIAGELLGTLKKITAFDEDCTRFYSAQILDTIEYMHAKGVIHRDLKPENVLLDDKMHVKITDFGTAKLLSSRSPVDGSGPLPGDPLENSESDRAVSFVGTAEYVSPELLTEKNACKASDLWAFGCIVYQLLAGRPPFKAANEYLTFQKIVGLEYVFPEGFPLIARDLIERLLVLDPTKRLPTEHIKNHQFFDGIKWGKRLWHQKAPRLKSFVPPAQEPIRLNGPSTSGLPAGHSSSRSAQPRLLAELPPPSQLDIEWSPVLTRNNERILKLGNLNVTVHPAPHSPNAKNGDVPAEPSKKISRFFGGTTRRRQRLVMITSSGRVIVTAAGGEEKKAKLDISLLAPGTSWRNYKDAKGLTAWILDNKEKHIVFEDPKATTNDPDGSRYSSQEWLDTIDRARELALSQSISSNEPASNEFNSAISSPSSTINGLGPGASGDFDGVNIPRSRRDDTDSIKKSKRFSKRHSKNGLSAVF